MELVSLLGVQLGAKFAKLLLQAWLGRDSVPNELAGELVETLTTWIPDSIDRQRARRLFDDLGQTVAESLVPLFEASSIDEGTQQAVLREIAVTISEAKVSPDMLAEMNLSSERLARYLLEINGRRATLLGAAGNALFRRAISESSLAIANSASRLPAFQERVAAAILKREDEIRSAVREACDDIRRLTKAQEKKDARESGFELKYRTAFASRWDRIELFGVRSLGGRIRHNLTIAYVDLGVEEEGDDDKVGAETHAEEFSELGGSTALVAESSETTQQDTSGSVRRVLGGTTRLLIKGGAGTGKTTLMQWIGVRSAKRDFPTGLQKLNDSIPFFVSLRQFATLPLPSPEEFVRSSAPEVAGEMPQGWAHDQLRSGRGIVLVDGVDELPEQKRLEILPWLESLTANFSQARFIVASRDYAIDPQWVANVKFLPVTMQSMDPETVDRFIDYWHKAMRGEISDPEELKQIEPLGNHLKNEIRRTRDLHRLATSPLLCGMMCALNRDRRGRLPQNRIRLYEAAIEMLLETRDVERGITQQGYPVLDLAEKRSFLEDLAFFLVRNGWAEIERERAIAIIQRHAERIPSLSGHSRPGARIYRMLTERSGVVREPTAGKMDFTHKTFQEFLAAKAAVDHDEIGLIAKQAHESNWREVVVWAAGLARPNGRAELIDLILKRADGEPPFEYVLNLMAVACLQIGVEIEPSLVKEVQSRLRRVIPPRGMSDAEMVASAGELAVDFLKTGQHHYARQTAACVRALAYIGTAGALEAIAGYANDTRQTVLSEIERAWDYFDRQQYARVVVSRRVGKDGNLRLGRVTDLDGVEALPELTGLSVADCEKCRSLQPLTVHRQLRHLRLNYCFGIRDLEPLSELKYLVDLSLRFLLPPTRLEPIGTLEHLNMLVLDNVPLQDSKFLAKLVELRRLRIEDCEHFADLGELANMPHMEVLTLANTSVEDLSPLASVSNLHFLRLDGSNRIQLGTLPVLPELRSLSLRECNIGDIAALGRLAGLRYLDLRFNPDLQSIAPLATLPNLRQLVIDNSDRIEDLRNLEGREDLRIIRTSRVGPVVMLPTNLIEK